MILRTSTKDRNVCRGPQCVVDLRTSVDLSTVPELLCVSWKAGVPVGELNVCLVHPFKSAILVLI